MRECVKAPRRFDLDSRWKYGEHVVLANSIHDAQLSVKGVCMWNCMYKGQLTLPRKCEEGSSVEEYC